MRPTATARRAALSGEHETLKFSRQRHAALCSELRDAVRSRREPAPFVVTTSRAWRRISCASRHDDVIQGANVYWPLPKSRVHRLVNHAWLGIPARMTSRARSLRANIGYGTAVDYFAPSVHVAAASQRESCTP